MADSQKLLEYREWMAENIIPAPEPPGGWPAPPWDHCFFVAADGALERLVVDADGAPILDADGEEVMSGPGFGFVLCKPLRGGSRVPEFTIPTDVFEPEAEEVLQRARELAERLGHAHVGDEHVGLALAERLDDPPPLVREHLRKGMTLNSDGPHAEARLALLDERDATGWTRPSRNGALPPAINSLLAKALKYAAVRALGRGGLATCEDLLEGILQPMDLPPPPPPPAVLWVMRNGRENRFPAPIEYH